MASFFPHPRILNERGSVLVVVMVCIAVLAILVAGSLIKVSENYTTSYQSASWQEALNAADSGVDLAVQALNANDWTNWTTVTQYDWERQKTVIASRWYAAPALTHAGEGSTTLQATVTVDSPASLLSGGQQWYRIRSVGVADISGPRRLPYDSMDVRLRKISLDFDRNTGKPLTKGQVTRWVEAIAKPNSSQWKRALTLQNWISMSGGAFLDSFDSTDPTKSTNGLYDIAKRQSHGNVGSLNSTSSDLKGMYVYGDLTWTGPEPLNDQNVQGVKTSPLSETIDPVVAPTWTTFNGTPTSITSTTTLTGGPKSAPARYKVSAITISAGKSLTWDTHAPGQESYVEVWVTGKLTTSGTGFIVQNPGVHVTYYVEDDITVSGSSFNNKSNVASNLLIYGVNPATGTNKLTVSGSGNFIGIIDAPKYDMTVSGGASLSGAFIGNTLTVSGSGGVHYDEALSGGASGSNKYTLASWVECY